MRVAVVFFSGRNGERVKEISQGLVSGVEAQGHQVDIINGDTDENMRLSLYQYLIICSSTLNTFGGKLPERIATFLANAGTISGKRTSAFVLKTGMRVNKTLSKLMHILEQEGLYLKLTDVIASKEEAVAIGKRLHIA